MCKKAILYTFLLVALIVVSAFLMSSYPVSAQTLVQEQQLVIYFFYGDGCPHCAKAKPYLEGLPPRYPGLVLTEYEIYYNQENHILFMNMLKQFDLDQVAVPTIFIGPYYLQGYSEAVNEDIEAVIEKCLQEGCADIGKMVIAASTQAAAAGSADPQATATLPVSSEITPVPSVDGVIPSDGSVNLSASRELEIPFFGDINLNTQSSLISTALIALVDGFNPCSLWVLSMLIALTLHSGSRKKVFLVGLVFLTVTAGIYALFIAGLFSVLKITSFMGWVRIIIALIALFFALVNIKDYFWYKEGFSLSIAKDKKPGLFRNMRALTNTNLSFWGLIGTTIVLATGVSMVEFSCTAGFPVLWVNILTEQNISGTVFILLLLLYMLIYQLDELVIFITSVVTLKASRMEEKHGRILKLISGMLMLTLAIVMLINPALLNDLGSSLIVFGVAFLATLLLILTHRILLPRFGIIIGTEQEAKKRHKARSTTH
jgi:glutaredoxin